MPGAPRTAIDVAQRREVKVVGGVAVVLWSMRLVQLAFGHAIPRPVDVAVAGIGGFLLLCAGFACGVRSHVEVDVALEERRAAHRRRVNELLKASGGMAIAYQPIVELATGRVVGHEALARFPDGTSPQRWFDEARELDLVVELELASIAHAIRGHRGSGYLSVNVGPQTLLSSELPRCLGGPRPPIVLELTEHEAIADYAAICDALAGLRRGDVRLAVDDVGSGTSSLQHVLAVQPDVLKLDRVLLAGVELERPRRALIGSIVQFAAKVGVEVVAEGIETEDELDMCQMLGIALGQGYLLGRPRVEATWLDHVTLPR